MDFALIVIYMISESSSPCCLSFLFDCEAPKHKNTDPKHSQTAPVVVSELKKLMIATI